MGAAERRWQQHPGTPASPRQRVHLCCLETPAAACAAAGLCTHDPGRPQQAQQPEDAQAEEALGRPGCCGALCPDLWPASRSSHTQREGA